MPSNLIGLKAAVERANAGGRVFELGGTQETYTPPSSTPQGKKIGAVGSARDKNMGRDREKARKSQLSQLSKKATRKGKGLWNDDNDTGWDDDETLGAYIK